MRQNADEGLSRYTHRVAISNSRLIALGEAGVTFKWEDYRARGKAPGKAWIKPMKRRRGHA